MTKHLTGPMISLWLMLSAAAAPAQQLECTPVLPEETLQHIASTLCATQWRQIALASNMLNASGSTEDLELERFGAILNELEKPEPQLSPSQTQELIATLGARAQLRGSIRKNLLVTLFSEDALDTWCRYRHAKNMQDFSVAARRDIIRVEEFLTCGQM